MANFFFYNASGEKVGPVTGVALKTLAQKGVITPETTIENEHGRTTVASQVKGLTFTETKQPEIVPPVDTQPEIVQPVQTESYDVSAADNPYANLSAPPFDMPALSDVYNVSLNESVFQESYASIPSSGGMATSGRGNATARKTQRTAYQTKQTPVLLDWVLLDFRFRFFLTPILLKIIWCMWVVLIELLVLTIFCVVPRHVLLYGLAGRHTQQINQTQTRLYPQN